jgi:hypothetical protein
MLEIIKKYMPLYLPLISISIIKNKRCIKPINSDSTNDLAKLLIFN